MEIRTNASKIRLQQRRSLWEELDSLNLEAMEVSDIGYAGVEQLKSKYVFKYQNVLG